MKENKTSVPKRPKSQQGTHKIGQPLTPEYNKTAYTRKPKEEKEIAKPKPKPKQVDTTLIHRENRMMVRVSDVYLKIKNPRQYPLNPGDSVTVMYDPSFQDKTGTITKHSKYQD